MLWAEAIIENVKRKERNIHKIKESFEINEYSPAAGISKLMNIYQITSGGTHEKSINRLI